MPSEAADSCLSGPIISANITQLDTMTPIITLCDQDKKNCQHGPLKDVNLPPKTCDKIIHFVDYWTKWPLSHSALSGGDPLSHSHSPTFQLPLTSPIIPNTHSLPNSHTFQLPLTSPHHFLPSPPTPTFHSHDLPSPSNSHSPTVPTPTHITSHSHLPIISPPPKTPSSYSDKHYLGKIGKGASKREELNRLSSLQGSFQPRGSVPLFKGASKREDRPVSSRELPSERPLPNSHLLPPSHSHHLPLPTHPPSNSHLLQLPPSIHMTSYLLQTPKTHFITPTSPSNSSLLQLPSPPPSNSHSHLPSSPTPTLLPTHTPSNSHSHHLPLTSLPPISSNSHLPFT